MKKKIFVISILMFQISLFSEDTLSQSGNKRYFGSFGAAVSFPADEYSDLNTPGFEFGGKAGYIFSNYFAGGIATDFNTFSEEYANSYFSSSGTTNLFSLRPFLMAGNLKKDVKLKPYSIVGAGLYYNHNSVKIVQTSESDYTQTNFDFGMDLGVGLSYKVSNNMSVFVEPKYSGFFVTYPNHYYSVKMGLMFGQ